MGYGQTKIVEAAAAQMIKLPFNSPFATIAGPAAKLAKVQPTPQNLRGAWGGPAERRC